MDIRFSTLSQVFSRKTRLMSKRSGLQFGFILSLSMAAGLSCAPANWLMPAAHATRLPGDMSKMAVSVIGGRVRLDGAVETPDGQLYLLLLPSSKEPHKGKIEVESCYPNPKQAELVLYSNGMTHVRVAKKGEATTIQLKTLPEKLRKRLLASHFPSDLIVPQKFVLPKSAKGMVQDLPSVALIEDGVLNDPNFGDKKKIERSTYKGHGTIFLTSITSGSITMLDGKTFAKIAEFPTEGTPCSMDINNGTLYIADEAKNRILLLDPSTRKFAGQIDLPPHSAPKAIASLPNGQWLYVSESGSSDVAVVDLGAKKVLMRTKVHPGPGPMLMTPDGNYLLVLSVTSGELTIIATDSQKVAGTVRVGDMPTSVAVSHDCKLAYVANRISNTISIVDLAARRVINTIKCGQSPTAVLINSDDTKLYVAAGRDNTITEYDCASLASVHDLKFSSDMQFPGSLCMLPDGHHFIVISQGSDAMSEVDADTLQLQNHIALEHPNHQAVWEPVP
jgi:YVTN family beta-propeller protein